ncbi:MAG: cytidylate kinase [Gammaproteobacteria bacterium]|nr:cytidylate kinase [Gammaproteobacteria bacterium]MCH2577357.1 (d)CMP kinase [Pseudomonadales bacterium]MED5529893.1 (d)CMP kinase [Pseudomonadota bacterium]
MNKIPVITIDGPSGSGKGTVATLTAKDLGFRLLDSGALYRSLAVSAIKREVNLEDHQQLADLARCLNIEFDLFNSGSVWLDGEDVSLSIRTDIVSKAASLLGTIPAVRTALHEQQLAFRKEPGLVADGRDMGTVVFPDALVKIYLTARLEERVQRRYKQLIDKGIDATLPLLLRDLKERDAKDSERPISPLKPAKDAVVLDTTDLQVDQVVQLVMSIVRDRLAS